MSRNVHPCQKDDKLSHTGDHERGCVRSMWFCHGLGRQRRVRYHSWSGEVHNLVGETDLKSSLAEKMLLKYTHTHTSLRSSVLDAIQSRKMRSTPS